MTTAKTGAAAQFLKAIGFDEADIKAMSDMVADATIAAKAEHAATTEGAPHIPDRWMAGHMHAVPTAEQIKVGPSQSASGGGAEHMVSQYSNDAPQKGLTLEAERLAAVLHQLQAQQKSLTLLIDGHNGLCETVVKSNELLSTLQDQNRRITLVCAGLIKKAEDEEEKEDDKKEDKEESMRERFGKAAAKALKKARKLHAKSLRIREAAKTAEGSDIEALKSQSKLFKKAAKSAFAKAWKLSEGVIETRKAVDEFFLMYPSMKSETPEAGALGEARKARKEWKAAAKAVQGHGDASGNQSDKKDGATGNQDDSAVKAQIEEMSTKINNALEGFGMLKTTVGGLMEAVAGRPVTPDVAPLSLMKGDPVAVVKALDTKIEEMTDRGELDPTMEHRARDVLSKYQATRAGQMLESTFKGILEGSPLPVQEIFRQAA